MVPPHKVLHSPLHIKLGLIKQFGKSLPSDGNCLKYLISKFPGLDIRIEKFLGNNKDSNYKKNVKGKLTAFTALDCLMSKTTFSSSHLDYFPQNLRNVSEDQRERLQQDIKEMEKKIPGKMERVNQGRLLLDSERPS